ncbi:rhodanese-like domain-containing protein [Planococcus sp. ISL-109]|uniref:rhodanese-like domain-containing protein n=1 Tax=Planococcus sp. ISL-109 TaxID=2819166 RepID=UPI001BE7F40D|nr:rhodanese-like domain-containing protein [Planococcus sp. ISL-109]MBT2582710.1 rhodanese-like domain-containing protein [Planococcus sp. ISL-109]
MEWLLWIAVGIIAYFVISRFTAPTKGIRTMSTEELKAVLGKKDKQYVDVRTPVEFKANNIKGFKNIPLNDLPKRLNELSKDKETLVICQSGMRSSKASQLLKKNGFTDVVNIRGGMSSYRG